MVVRIFGVLLLCILSVSSVYAVELDEDDDGKIDAVYLPTVELVQDGDPANATDGQLWYNNATNQLKVREGSLVYFWNATGSEAFDDGSVTWLIDDTFTSDTSSSWSGNNYLTGGASTLVITTANGTAVNSDTYRVTAYRHSTSIGSDQIIEATVTPRGSGAYPGVIVAATNTFTGFGVAVCGPLNSILSYPCTDSSTTPTSSASLSFSGGKTWGDGVSHKMRVEKSSTTVSVYVDWNDDGDFLDADEDIGDFSGVSNTGAYAGLFWVGSGSDNSVTLDFRSAEN